MLRVLCGHSNSHLYIHRRRPWWSYWRRHCLWGCELAYPAFGPDDTLLLILYQIGRRPNPRRAAFSGITVVSPSRIAPEMIQFSCEIAQTPSGLTRADPAPALRSSPTVAFFVSDASVVR